MSALRGPLMKGLLEAIGWDVNKTTGCEMSQASLSAKDR